MIYYTATVCLMEKIEKIHQHCRSKKGKGKEEGKRVEAVSNDQTGYLLMYDAEEGWDVMGWDRE